MGVGIGGGGDQACNNRPVVVSPAQHTRPSKHKLTGRRKRIFGARAIMRYKRPDFKKAYVTLGGEGGSSGPAIGGGAGAGAAAP